MAFTYLMDSVYNVPQSVPLASIKVPFVLFAVVEAILTLVLFI
jgi:hypothetical protein